jgi:hypothetical protein
MVFTVFGRTRVNINMDHKVVLNVVRTLNWEDRCRSSCDHDLLLKSGEGMSRVFFPIWNSAGSTERVDLDLISTTVSASREGRWGLLRMPSALR